MSLIKLQNISKIYGFGDATTIALDEIDLKIEKGEFVAVMGPSGSGKSTLMNIIGLLDRPTIGNYLFEGKYVSRIRSDRAAKLRRDSVGFIFQSFNLLNRLTVLENVSLPLIYKGYGQYKRYKLAGNILERVGIKNREYFYPNQLSGGQAQCAAIARALINNPKLIIADEPTGNLDSAGSRLIMEILSDIHSMGNTIIFVTHNPELTRYATRVVYMHDGNIIYDEKTAVGRVAKRARKTLYTIPTKTIDDDLEGISTLMKAIPQPNIRPTKKTKKSQKYSKKVNKRRLKK
jgi:putative ABC transport system ATP-binding protein